MKTRFALFLFLIFVSVILATLNMLYKQNGITEKPQKTIMDTVTPTPISQCALVMSPTTINAKPGLKSSVNITIGSDGNFPTAIQLEIGYDQSAITDIAITPGDFFKNPNITLSNIDQTTGRISYAIELPINQKPTQRSGTIATISFIQRSDTPLKQSEIYFLPKTAVRSYNQITTIKDAVGSTLLLSPQFNTASQSSQPKTQPH